MHQIEEALNSIDLYTVGQKALQTEVPPISWVDDLAIPLKGARPDQLVPLVERAPFGHPSIFSSTWPHNEL